MIERIKTITYEVRSHGFLTKLTEDGRVRETMAAFPTLVNTAFWTKGYIKKRLWHLQDVLKCMRQIEKEKQANKEKP